MDSLNDINGFLTSRRERLTPQQAGLPDYGGRRRVKGLRREEVALLAGMSTEYYTRLERGNAAGASEAVLDGISRALQLDEVERTHLYDLVRTASSGVAPARRPRTKRSESIRPGLQQTIDAMDGIPVYIQNRRLDIIATNQLGRALFFEVFDMPERPSNTARYVFLDPRAQDFYPDWEGSARRSVAMLRAEAGRSPYDRALSDLVGELSTRSDFFGSLWASHDVKEHRTGSKTLHHLIVGDLTLEFEVMDLSKDFGLQLIGYSAAPGSASHDGLKLLASWAATSQAPITDIVQTASGVEDER